MGLVTDKKKTTKNNNKSSAEQEPHSAHGRAVKKTKGRTDWLPYFTVPLSTQGLKWVSANCWGRPDKLLPGITFNGLAFHQGVKSTAVIFYSLCIVPGRCGGLMVSALDSGLGSQGSSPGRGTALCSWARHFTLIVPLSTQVYKWVPANLLLGVTLRWTSIPSRGE